MTQNLPAVSVVMPVYNVERFVAAAIDSVLAQSFTDFELIIVDDGGNDRSVEICAAYADPRIRILHQANRGLAGARNTGIAAARGRYIALLDSDDIWLPGKLAENVAHLDADPDVGVSYSGAILVNERGEDLGVRQTPLVGRIDARQVFCGRGVCNGSIPVFRREALEQAALPRDAEGRVWYFDESLRRSEDVECWTRIALRSPLAFECLPGFTTLYRVNAGGLSADIPRQLQSWEDVVDRIAAFAPEFIARHRREARAREVRYLARRAVAMRDARLAVSLSVEAVTLQPALLVTEPRKTLTTLGAALALRVLSPYRFERLLRRVKPGLAGDVS
ncbi:glycosyltransferase [Rhodovarius crocodyli]|uniref:Glycosyltransferase n=1 Tax=Rhodovarius crocodyli TaxID=1979269 RepID=A0A437MGG5_9PROT|nr:glycosyltransferase [Rhodovarius crocodyli]RVT96748.1 glycosyltransferase [Rhodovarius crocodyli]